MPRAPFYRGLIDAGLFSDGLLDDQGDFCGVRQCHSAVDVVQLRSGDFRYALFNVKKIGPHPVAQQDALGCPLIARPSWRLALPAQYAPACFNDPVITSWFCHSLTPCSRFPLSRATISSCSCSLWIPCRIRNTRLFQWACRIWNRENIRMSDTSQPPFYPFISFVFSAPFSAGRRNDLSAFSLFRTRIFYGDPHGG
jgi:hypothetical protein